MRRNFAWPAKISPAKSSKRIWWRAARPRRGDRYSHRSHPAAGRHRHHGDAGIRGPWPDRVKAALAAQYVDHNLLQTDNKNADDHKYLQTACARYGIHFTRPGNGVSHQVHMERFGRPGADPARRRQPQHRRRRGVDARHRRRRPRRRPGHGRLSLLPPLPQGLRGQAHRPAPRLGQRQGRHPRNAAALRRQGGRGQDHRILRPRRGHPLRYRPRDDRQHGDRTRRHHHPLPLRRAHPPIS